jgi:ABC-type bacteriocin/lantibiotic exporter with double-glycine peptidase domain
LLGLGGWLVIQRELTLGQLVAAELIVGNITRSFAKFGKHFESYYDLLASTNKLGHLFDLPLERLSGEAFPNAGQAVSVKLSELEFAYPDGRDLFGGLNTEIAALDRVAVIGPSGSGKSTLLQLLYGLRTPSRGFIQIDGIDLRQLNLVALRSQIALVQKLDLMAGSILDNVRWGRNGLTITEVNSALAAAGLLDTVLRLPSGLETQISPDGCPLSGGQARALTIARAIAGKPRLLLLDGALDDLEGELLERVIAIVFDPRSPWTLFIVTTHDEILKRCVKSLSLQNVASVVGPAFSR